MRRLFPDPGETDPIDEYTRLRSDGDRPRVRLNMIASLDGAGSLDGHSAAGGDAKRILDGGLLQPPARFELCHLLTKDGFLFLRYVR